MRKEDYSINTIKKLDESIIKQWKELWEKAENANIYNSYEWFLACVETFTIKEYEVYVCYKDGKLIAVLPLQPYKCFGVKVYGTFCRERLVDTPFLMKNYEKETFKYFFENVFKRHNIYLQKLDDKATKILHELFPHLFIVLISVNPFIDLTGDPISAMLKSMVNRITKIMKKNTDVLRYEIYNTNLQKYFKALLALQEKSSKKTRSMDIFEDKKTKDYYSALIKYCNKFVRINILYYNDLPIVYEFGFLYKNMYVGDQISYHNDYKQLSPGKIMIFRLIEHLKNKNKQVTTLDQGGGISDYKQQFTQKYRLFYNVYYSNNIFVLFWWKSINKIRRVKQVLFPKKFTRDHEFLFKTL